MLGGYDDTDALEDDIYCEDSSSETSIDSEVEFHLYSQVHYAQGQKDVSGEEETEGVGSEKKQSAVSKDNQRNNFVIISDSDVTSTSNSPDIITLSDSPDEDSIYKSKLQKLAIAESPVPGRAYNLVEFMSSKPVDSSPITLNSKRWTTEISRKEKRTNEKSVSFHRDGVHMIHKILVIEDSSGDENADEVASIASESDHVESWMLLGGAKDDKDDDILLNLEGCGTLASEGENGAGWNISDKDLEAQIGNYGTVRHSNRYYMPDKNVTCRNCDKRGHLSKNCPTPKKIPPCCLCAQRGHLQNSCPARYCLNCCLPGHYSRECLEKTYWKKHCHRCGMRGHYADACPEIWRQYHLTTRPGPLKKARSYPELSASVYCYNCSEKGHYGYECSEKRMFGGTFPTSPFIYYYDNEYDFKRNIWRAKKKVEEFQEAGLMPKAVQSHHVDDSQKVHRHKRKKKMLKDLDKIGDKHHKKLKQRSQAGTLRGRKDKQMVHGNYTVEEDFPRGGHMNVLKRSRKTRAHGSVGLPGANGDKAESLQVSLETAKKRKRKKKQRIYSHDTFARDESLFLIKQKKKKSKQKPSC